MTTKKNQPSGNNIHTILNVALPGKNDFLMSCCTFPKNIIR